MTGGRLCSKRNLLGTKQQHFFFWTWTCCIRHVGYAGILTKKIFLVLLMVHHLEFYRWALLAPEEEMHWVQNHWILFPESIVSLYQWTTSIFSVFRCNLRSMLRGTCVSSLLEHINYTANSGSSFSCLDGKNNTAVHVVFSIVNVHH